MTDSEYVYEYFAPCAVGHLLDVDLFKWHVNVIYVGAVNSLEEVLSIYYDVPYDWLVRNREKAIAYAIETTPY